MFGWLRFGPQPMRIWLFREINGPWVKVVGPNRPTAAPYRSETVQGPFRSEADAEQAADRLNARFGDRVTPYHSQPPVEGRP